MKENHISVSQLLSRDIRFFLGDVKLFCIVLAGDLDLERVRFLEVSPEISKILATKNFAI